MILDEIVADKKKRLPQHKANISEQKMREMAEEMIKKRPVEKKGKMHFMRHLPRLGFPLSENLKRHLQVLEQ